MKKENNNMKKTNNNDKVETIEEVINERKRLPKELKDKISNSIFANVVLVMFMTIITLIINIMFNKLVISDFQNYLKLIQIGVCLISIVFFEYAYKKDSFEKSIYGIEFVLFSIAVLFVSYMFILKDNIYFLRNILIVFAIYYFIKSIITFIYYRNKYLKENISDVKEIVKEEKKGYLDEESSKTLKEQKKKKAEETKQNELNDNKAKVVEKKKSKKRTLKNTTKK